MPRWSKTGWHQSEDSRNKYPEKPTSHAKASAMAPMVRKRRGFASTPHRCRRQPLPETKTRRTRPLLSPRRFARRRRTGRLAHGNAVGNVWIDAERRRRGTASQKHILDRMARHVFSTTQSTLKRNPSSCDGRPASGCNEPLRPCSTR